MAQRPATEGSEVEVLGIDLPWMDGLVRAKPSQRVPMVLSVNSANG
ncbi:MAG: hypothetical protein WC742_08475 [Gallionellaceae bacterium]